MGVGLTRSLVREYALKERQVLHQVCMGNKTREMGYGFCYVLA